MVDWQTDPQADGAYTARHAGCLIRVWRIADRGIHYWGWYCIGDPDARPNNMYTPPNPPPYIRKRYRVMDNVAFGKALNYTPATAAAVMMAEGYAKGEWLRRNDTITGV